MAEKRAPEATRLDRTPSQTVGPFFHEALRWKDGGPMRATSGPKVVIAGRIVDGAGEPVADAMIEAWQRSPDGFVRLETANDGTYRIETVMPQGSPPFIDVAIFARGLLRPLRTRVYLAAEEDARRDPVLAPLAASPRVATLVARREREGEYRWNVRLQGEGETVFFA